MTTGKTAGRMISLARPTRVIDAVKPSVSMISTQTAIASAVLRSLPDVVATTPGREQAIVTHSEYRGNRVTHRFYPEHYARVQLARHNAVRYGGLG